MTDGGSPETDATATTRAAQRAATRLAELQACQAEIDAALAKYGAALSAERISRIAPDGSEHIEQRILVTLP